MVVLPIIALFVNSFLVLDKQGFRTTWGLNNYRLLLQDHVIRRAFLSTLIVSTGSTLLATFFGVTLAWLNSRTNCPFKEKLEPLNLIPFFFSPFVGAIAWHNLANPKIGLLNQMARDWFGVQGHVVDVDNLSGVIWVTGLFFAPIVYLFVVGSLRRMDPSLEDIARTTGASLARTTFTVTLPLVTPAILSGMIITFVSSAGDFGVPFRLSAPQGGETLTTQIFSRVVGDDANYPMGAAMSLSLAVITAVFIWIQRRIVAPREFTTVTGKGYRPNLVNLGYLRWPVFGFNLIYIGLGVLLPILSLVVVSMHRVWEGRIILGEMTFLNYRRIFFFWTPEHIAAATNGIVNSLILAFAGATLCMAFAIVLTYLIHRKKTGAGVLLDFLATLPIAFPGIVLAMGVLVTYIRTPIYATLWILLLGYITRFFPYGQRNVAAVMMAVSEELEQSSRLSGASWLQTIRRITIPLLKPGIFAGWILLFVIFLRELSISIILYTAGTETLSVGIYYLNEFENEPLTGALAVIQMVFLLICFVVFRRMAKVDSLSG
jgi:iron(III) transport system permease protein